MGVTGASLATAISKLCSFLILIFPYLARRSLLRVSLRYFRPRRDVVAGIVIVGSSAMFRSGLVIVSSILLNNIASGFSDSALAAIGVAHKLMTLPFGIILGLGVGYQPVSGTCLIPILPIMVRLGGAHGVASVQAADVLSLFLAIPIRRRVLGEVAEAACQQRLAEAAGGQKRSHGG